MLGGAPAGRAPPTGSGAAVARVDISGLAAAPPSPAGGAGGGDGFGWAAAADAPAPPGAAGAAGGAGRSRGVGGAERESDTKEGLSSYGDQSPMPTTAERRRQARKNGRRRFWCCGGASARVAPDPKWPRDLSERVQSPAFLHMVERFLMEPEHEDAPFFGDPEVMLRLPPMQETRVHNATFAMGCFWRAEANFGVFNGVLSTRVGYACGRTPHPSYFRVGDHAEVVQVEYDSAMLRYEDLLKIFWDGHDATAATMRSHSSLVVVHDQRQRRISEAFLARRQAQTRMQVRTTVLPYQHMELAEMAHQKYFLQQRLVLMRAFEGMSADRFLGSERATRANGFLGGFGTAQQLGGVIRKMRLTKSQEVDLSEAAAAARLGALP